MGKGCARTKVRCGRRGGEGADFPEIRQESDWGFHHSTSGF